MATHLRFSSHMEEAPRPARSAIRLRPRDARLERGGHERERRASAASDADLGRYAAILESPSGRRLTRATQQALIASLAPDTPRSGAAPPAVGE